MRVVGLRRAGQGQHASQLLRRGRDFLEYTVDLNPYKQGRHLPGSRIPIRAPEACATTALTWW